MIKYDQPAVIDYVLGVSGAESVAYVGHSQGTLTMFGLLSTQAKYNHLVKPFIALAPVSTGKDLDEESRIAPRVLRVSSSSSPLAARAAEFISSRFPFAVAFVTTAARTLAYDNLLVEFFKWKGGPFLPDRLIDYFGEKVLPGTERKHHSCN